MTLLEAEYLIDRTNKRIRTALTQELSKRSVAQDWAFANSLSPRDFDAQISSTLNRFHSFLRNEKLRLMFGQDRVSLDLGNPRRQFDGIVVTIPLRTFHGVLGGWDASKVGFAVCGCFPTASPAGVLLTSPS